MAQVGLWGASPPMLVLLSIAACDLRWGWFPIFWFHLCVWEVGTDPSGKVYQALKEIIYTKPSV